jgi:hypothetical protein
VQIRSAVRSSSKAQHRQLLPSSPPCGANEDSYTGEREMQGLRDGYFNDHRLSSAQDAEGVLVCSVSHLRLAINSHSGRSHGVPQCSLLGRQPDGSWFGASFTRRRLAKNSHARQRPPPAFKPNAIQEVVCCQKSKRASSVSVRANHLFD